LELRRDRGAARPAPSAEPPKVSVIIPFRNEAERMGGLLKSLGEETYPAEFIFIDDRSADRGPELLKQFIRKRGAGRLITVTENPGPNHKQYALKKGIEAAAGDFFLFTDADCEVKPGWIAAMTARMADERAGAALGPVFKRSGGKGFFFLYQCFDHAVRYMYLAGSTGLGAAGGGFGNNMILRKAALEAAGGYDAVPPSPTEDAALIARIRSHTSYQVRAVIGPGAEVVTASENSWPAFVNQTLRWNNGGLFSPDLKTRFNFGFLMITISIGILALPLLPFFPRLWPLPASVILAMTANTAATLALFGFALPKKGPAYILQLVFTPVYFTFLTILGLLGVKGSWKPE
jgi:cellulose synthase/poly-beta-1,6-N-acetylglucosamine synthase-like glycosyltransferase